MKTKLIFAAVITLGFACVFTASAQSPGPSSGKKPNILVIIPEFGNEKRVQGNLFQFAATWKF
jgi:hypothetical protein